jgi:ATP-binding cassette subfamily F protein uup
MDKVVDHIFEYRGEGVIKDFPGNYTQLREKQDEEESRVSAVRSVKAGESVAIEQISPKKEKKPGLTFKEKREFEELTSEIGKLEQEKRLIESEISTGNLSTEELYARSIRHGEILKMLDDKEMRWLELSEK